MLCLSPPNLDFKLYSQCATIEFVHLQRIDFHGRLRCPNGARLLRMASGLFLTWCLRIVVAAALQSTWHTTSKATQACCSCRLHRAITVPQRGVHKAAKARVDRAAPTRFQFDNGCNVHRHALHRSPAFSSLPSSWWTSSTVGVRIVCTRELENMRGEVQSVGPNVNS